MLFHSRSLLAQFFFTSKTLSVDIIIGPEKPEEATPLRIINYL